MDYEALLKKYIEFVFDTEGTTFIGHIHCNFMRSKVEFSEEEIKALKKLESEI